jgi:hypothetical protein
MNKTQAKNYFADKAQEHADLVEHEVERILNAKGIALDEKGIKLEQVIPEDNPLQFIYHVKKDGVILDTFGFEMLL